MKTIDNENETLSYSLEPHKPRKIKGLPWPVRAYCGLVCLKNPLTKWCIKMGCNHSYHKDYDTHLRTLS